MPRKCLTTSVPKTTTSEPKDNQDHSNNDKQAKKTKKKLVEKKQNIQMNIEPCASPPPPVVTFSNIELPQPIIERDTVAESRPYIPPPTAPEITQPIIVLCEDSKQPIATFSPIQMFTTTNPFEEDSSKKKGRKTKGGKLVMKNKEYEDSLSQISNVILHLKCSMEDLENYNINISKMVTNDMTYNPSVPPEIQTYNSDINSDKFSNYGENIHTSTEPSIIGNSNTTSGSFANDVATTNMIKYAYNDSNAIINKNPAMSLQSNYCKACNTSMAEETNQDFTEDKDVNMKDINQKLKHLKINLYKNTLQDKKSACFWCTYDYDNQPCYIPKYEMDGKIYGYGSFCRPECAVAYLMKENLDDSTKFERYHLLNNLYGKVYDFKKNIKPAPNPYYLLEKFYGILTIQEYRKLLKTEHLLTVIDKPLSRTLPELFEDNDNFLLGIYGGTTKSCSNNSNVFKVKRQADKTPTQSKTSIMKEKFGLA